MRNLTFRRWVAGLGGVIGLAAVLSIGWLISANGSEKALSQAIAPALPTATLSPLPTATPRPTAAPDLNEDITPPMISRANLQILRRSPRPPVMTQQEAMQVVYDHNIWPYAFGGEYKGRKITITVAYGLASFGHSTDLSGFAGYKPENLPESCRNFVGPCHIEAERCAKGQCTPTGQILERITNRPTWLLVYENIPYTGSCIPAPAICPVYAWAVFAVDEEFKTILGDIWSSGLP